MNSLHLADGSEKPAEVKGRARLYSMVVCPFVMGIHINIVDIIMNILYEKNKRQFEEILTEIMDNLQKYEDKLDVRRSNPGMLDILMWPWFDIRKALTLIHKQYANVDRYKKKFPHMVKWVEGMKIQPFVLKYRSLYKKVAKFLEARRANNVDYDNI
ncbi:hypothetical protein ALC56_06768 [Trachymyrmex septentrionalis]|uniref:Glutathione S-transferase omega-1 n=1 Tax=Trachymyrmex septentrionalis TaxID=34720 RepID=A0A195FFG9_9HYME|nr:hypothetical protein ALC56_06768 [Trachymyrmex septentrionalis]